MVEGIALTERFEEHRSHLRAVSYRILGSLSEADDAVQEAWLRYSRTDIDEIDNLGGWLTTVVARVCLNMLRSRESRREDPLEVRVSDPVAPTAGDPEQEAMLADSVGLALLVVLDRLSPAERLAFVLHDMFAVPFEDIAPLIDRSPTATRQLASRARRRVQGQPAAPAPDLARQREVIEAFLAASRAGDFSALVALLDPDVEFRADKAVLPSRAPIVLRGAETVGKRARLAGERAKVARLALVDGNVGAVVAPLGHLAMALRVTVTDGAITWFEIIAEPERLAELDIAILD